MEQPPPFVTLIAWHTLYLLELPEITLCTSSQVQGAGGIVCTLDAGSTISGCSSYLNSITHGANACVDGGLAAKSIAGSTIQNCHYTGTYGICSDSNFTDGGGNVADL